jgi:TonB family protein
MSANYSSATRVYAYQPTIIESKLLISRLAIQIAFVKDECKRDPRGFVKRLAHGLLTNPKIILAFVVATVVLAVVMQRPNVAPADDAALVDEPPAHVVMLEPIGPVGPHEGTGRVGFNRGAGEGSGPTPRRAHGGGGGGDHSPNPPQTGKLPPLSDVLAAIPIKPPMNRPALPVAGIQIDPALWKDLKAPVYGDPRSTSTTPSKGPGEGEGIGTNRGLGIGVGDGPGVGLGSKGNTGGGFGQTGCCGSGAGYGAGASGIMRTSEVDQRARLLSKPEPQYTEEARRNQISGTVMLRAVFASSGEVVQIRALNTLPFGLTERAIAAARQIRFVPAIKSGHPVSVYMQLEYNFNLY